MANNDDIDRTQPVGDGSGDDGGAAQPEGDTDLLAGEQFHDGAGERGGAGRDVTEAAPDADQAITAVALKESDRRKQQAGGLVPEFALLGEDGKPIASGGGIESSSALSDLLQKAREKPGEKPNRQVRADQKPGDTPTLDPTTTPSREMQDLKTDGNAGVAEKPQPAPGDKPATAQEKPASALESPAEKPGDRVSPPPAMDRTGPEPVTRAQFKDGSQYEFHGDPANPSQVKETVDGKTQTYTRGQDGKLYDESGKPSDKDFKLDPDGTLRVREGGMERGKTPEGGTFELKVESRHRADGTLESETKTSLDGTIQATTTFGADGKTPQKQEISLDGKKYRETTYTADGKPDTTTTFNQETGKRQSETKYQPDGSAVKTEFGEDGQTKTQEINYDRNNKISSWKRFDAEGNLTEESKYRPDGSRESQTRYENGRPASETTYDENGQERQRTESKYEGERLVSQTVHRPDHSSTEIQFGEGGKKTSEKNYGPTGRVQSETEYQADGKTPKSRTDYDEFGRKASLTNYSEEGKPRSQTKFDPYSGNKISETSFRSDGTTPALETQYDKYTGNKTSETKYHLNGKIDTQTNFWSDGKPKDFKHYDDQGRLWSETKYTAQGKPFLERTYDPTTGKPSSSTVTAYDSGGNKESETRYDGDGRRTYEERFDPKTGRPVERTTYHANTGHPERVLKLGQDGKPRQETVYDQDGKRIFDATMDSRGNPLTVYDRGAESRYSYDKDGKLLGYETKDRNNVVHMYDGNHREIRHRTPDGKEFVHARDESGKEHVFEDKKVDKLPAEPYKDVPEWRQKQLDKRAQELVDKYKKTGNGQIDFHGFADMMDEIGKSKDLTEQEKINVWSNIASRRGAELPFNTNGAKPAVLDSYNPNSDIWHAVIHFSDGYHAPMAHLSPGDAASKIYNHELKGQVADQWRVGLGASMNTGDYNASVAQVAALRQYLQGGFQAYATAWRQGFTQPRK